MSNKPDETTLSENDALIEETPPEKEAPNESQPAILKLLPAIQQYQKTYANSCGNNDAKAIKLFKEYESRDKLQRLRTELIAVSQGRAAEPVCNKLIGLTRKSKYNGYDKWALMALGVLNSRT